MVLRGTPETDENPVENRERICYNCARKNRKLNKRHRCFPQAAGIGSANIVWEE